MEHAEVIHKVARALHEEYSYIERQPRWDDLHDEAKGHWNHLARVAINTHNKCLETT